MIVARFTLGVATFGLAACDDRQPPDPPHVIVLSLDTVRADRLGCYGGDPGTTPRIDAFAATADRYVSCTAPSSWTLPSHASLFTGLFPHEHGTHGFRTREVMENAYVLADDQVTLAEALAACGYETAAFITNTVYLAPRYGVGQGFETYEVMRLDAEVVADDVMEFLDAREGEEPLFLFVNFMDAHRPYNIAPFADLQRLAPDEHPSQLLERLCRQVMEEGAEPGDLGQRVSDLYDLAVQRLDAQIGRLLDGLDARAMLDNAIVVITSDHGEAFGTHGIVEHAKDVYEPLVSVPLIVRAPEQRAGRTVEEHASLVDVPGLIGRRLTGGARFRLTERFGRLPGSHPVISELYFARPRELKLYGERFQRQRWALREGSYKLILGPSGPELYDLDEDPGELVDLASREPQRVERMAATLERELDQGKYAGERRLPREPTPVQRTEINELGYGGR